MAAARLRRRCGSPTCFRTLWRMTAEYGPPRSLADALSMSRERQWSPCSRPFACCTAQSEISIPVITGRIFPYSPVLKIDIEVNGVVHPYASDTPLVKTIYVEVSSSRRHPRRWRVYLQSAVLVRWPNACHEYVGAMRCTGDGQFDRT